MADEQNQKDTVQIPSINTQVLAGTILTGLWMLNINQKLRNVIAGQRNIIASQRDINDGLVNLATAIVNLDEHAVSVREIINLVNKDTEKGNQ